MIQEADVKPAPFVGNLFCSSCMGLFQIAVLEDVAVDGARYACPQCEKLDAEFVHMRWMTAEEDLDYVVEHLWAIKHQPILSSQQIRSLRSADEVEVRAGAIQEYLP